MMTAPSYDNRRSATLACLLEATAGKVGNVHRGADFDDLCFTDFAISAVMLGEAMGETTAGVGSRVLRAVTDTQSAVASNTNLGIALLVAPLAAAELPLESGIAETLANLNERDAADVYAAIRLANPGGLGEAEDQDVNRVEAPPSLLDAMRMAESRDLIARQYANRFADVFSAAAEIERWLDDGESIESSIVLAHLSLLARLGDSLIARKLGEATSQNVAARAQQVLDLQSREPGLFWNAVGDLDFYLRSDGHARNPGATADLIAAALFVLLKEGRIATPFPTVAKRPVTGGENCSH